MNGIFVRPEKLEEALKREWFDLEGSSDPISEDRDYSVFDEIMESGKSEDEKLDNLLKKGFILEREYILLKRRISDEETIPRKIVVSYPKQFLDKHFGPITLRQAVYAFCKDRNGLREYEREKVVGSFNDERGLLKLVRGKMNVHEHELVFNNSVGYEERRKNGKNIN